MVEKIYYAYAFVYFTICLYTLLKKPEEIVLDFGVEDTQQALKFAKKELKRKFFPFIISIIGYVWVIFGLFTDYAIIFGSILILNIIVPLVLMRKTPEQIIKITNLWTATESILVGLIIYRHFSPLLFQN